MRISDWSSDVCSSDLPLRLRLADGDSGTVQAIPSPPASLAIHSNDNDGAHRGDWRQISAVPVRQRSEQLGIFDSPPGNGYLSPPPAPMSQRGTVDRWSRSEEHTSELKSLMRISY